MIHLNRTETFAVEHGYLIRKVQPRYGRYYEHRCPLDVYRELAWAAIDLMGDGFSTESLAHYVRNRPREKHDDSPTRASFTNAAVATAFWKERGLLYKCRKLNHVEDDGFFEDAMIEFHALAEER